MTEVTPGKKRAGQSLPGAGDGEPQDLFSLALIEGFPEQSWLLGLREGQRTAEKNMGCCQQP